LNIDYWLHVVYYQEHWKHSQHYFILANTAILVFVKQDDYPNFQLLSSLIKPAIQQ